MGKRRWGSGQSMRMPTRKGVRRPVWLGALLMVQSSQDKKRERSARLVARWERSPYNCMLFLALIVDDGDYRCQVREIPLTFV